MPGKKVVAIKKVDEMVEREVCYIYYIEYFSLSGIACLRSMPPRKIYIAVEHLAVSLNHMYVVQH